MGKEPTQKEIEEFQEKQGKLYDAINSFDREKEGAFEKKEPSVYQEADRKTEAANEEIERNMDEWYEEEYGK
jgi:hypothetical protein